VIELVFDLAFDSEGAFQEIVERRRHDVSMTEAAYVRGRVVRDPANAFRSMSLPLKGSTQLSVN